jgi:hypothetical protein
VSSEIIARHPWLGTLAWQSTICLAAGLGGSRLWRRRAVRAHQILFLSLIAAALIPALSQVVRLNRWGLFVAERTVPEPVQRLPAAQDDPVMLIALHAEIDLYDLDAPADSQHNQTYVFEQRLDGKRLDLLMTVNRLRDGAWRCEQVNRRVFTGEQFLYRQQQTVGSGSNPLTVVLYPKDEAIRIMAYDYL